MTKEFNIYFIPGKLFHSLIFFTLFFPFIPSLIPSTDTQPTFLLLISISLLYLLVQYKALPNYYSLSYNKLLGLISLFILTIFLVAINNFIGNKPILWARIISFFQFMLAIFFALSSKYFFEEKTLKRVFFIFAIFSVIFFLTKGLVERILIPSRAESFEMLVESGRGARTLSPEPAFFALHILNLFVIYSLLFGSILKSKKNRLLFFVALFCLTISLSGYGAVIAVLLLTLRYTKIAIVTLGTLAALSGMILEYFGSLAQFRGLSLLLKIISDNPLVLINTDRSFSTRVASFVSYLENIQKNLVLGDGFTVNQGGGYISIISSIGIIGLLFFIYFLIKVFRKRISGKLKFLIFFWFLINLFSGPIGIPTLGFIIGLILRKQSIKVPEGHLSTVQNG